MLFNQNFQFAFLVKQLFLPLLYHQRQSNWRRFLHFRSKVSFFFITEDHLMFNFKMRTRVVCIQSRSLLLITIIICSIWPQFAVSANRKVERKEIFAAFVNKRNAINIKPFSAFQFHSCKLYWIRVLVLKFRTCSATLSRVHPASNFKLLLTSKLVA